MVPAVPRSRSFRAISVKTTEASPRGPNQPMKATVDGRRCVPSSAIATGTILISVRLRIAYTMGRAESEWVSSLPMNSPPKIDQTRKEADSPSVSANWPGACRRPRGRGPEQDSAGKGRDEPVPADRDRPPVGEQCEGEDGDLLGHVGGPPMVTGQRHIRVGIPSGRTVDEPTLHRVCIRLQA